MNRRRPYLTNVDLNALQVVLRKIRNANVRSLARTSTQFRSVTESELHRRRVQYNAAQKNARQMYDNLRGHYEAISSGEGYGSNTMGVADTLAYWTLTPSKHADLLRRYQNGYLSMKRKKKKKKNVRRMRQISKYPTVYSQERNNAAKNYLPSSNSNSNTNRHRRQPIDVN